MNAPSATQAPYIRRDEEEDIRRQLQAVQDDRRSRAVLLYGAGGVGKTWLVREMSRQDSDDSTVWLDPIDVDDPRCWLLSDLERRVADKLDPQNVYFAEYRQRLSELPNPARVDISHETIVSYLGRVKEVFARCYDNFVTQEQKTVVITFDTVETIRGTNLLLTLTRWMRALPTATLFVLSGRPLPAAPDQLPDKIEAELESPYQGMKVTTVEVRGFTRDAALAYLRNSGISQALIGQEEEKLVLLSRGHPLWLAFVVDYLKEEGVPREAGRHPLEYLEQHLPYGAEMTTVGVQLHEEFLRQLVAPYKETDFWHEAIKRLAIVRQPVAKDVWQQLMADRRLPSGVSSYDEMWPDSMDEAWRELKKVPWIRQRGGDQYVTLHDAVAEEFAKRLFPLHDENQEWRHGIWVQALDIYRRLAEEAEENLAPRLAELQAVLRRFDSVHQRDSERRDAGIEAALIDRAATLDARKRELDQLKASGLYYLFLSNYERGCVELLDFFHEAERQHDSFFQDLLVLYLQRFLPGGSQSEAFNDVIKAKLDEFRDWLRGSRPDLYIDLTIVVARHLIDASQPEDALSFLLRVPAEAASVRQRHDMFLLNGNACLRIGGRVKEGLEHFNRAVDLAEGLTSGDRHKLIAQAYKERGFYHRNIGQWAEADSSYQHAWETLVRTMSGDSTPEDRDELASIQTNWAYVKGLMGSYRDGLELVETAISTRRRMGRPDAEGMSYSVYGEVYRYARRFGKAWDAYLKAERLLQGRRHWSWMGLIYQEQAICLYQAAEDGITIIPDQDDEARKRIARALEICAAQLIRGYPAALNRAGRILGDADPAAGLKYLEQGIKEAHRLSDGWFWFANLVEYAELNFQLWHRDREQTRYLANITERSNEIQQVAEDFAFPDLKGRWKLLQAHLVVDEYLDAGDASKLEGALELYETGFVNLAERLVASSGTASLSGEFATFRSVISQLPAGVQATWQARLRSAWAAAGSIVLLARLEELFRPAG
jgi:tetratricopeptide (TPR) repeat protein